MVAATAIISGTSGAVSGWAYNYTSSGGIIKVSVYISAYVNIAGAVKSWYIYRDTTLKATGTMCFNQSSTHAALPVLIFLDTTRLATTSTWKVQVETGVYVDTNDRCTMTIAEF